MTPRSWTVAGLLAAFVLVALAGLVVVIRGCDNSADAPSSDGEPTVMTDRELARDRPKVKRSFGKRLATRRAHPAVATSAGRPDTTYARRYADAVRRADSLQRVIDSARAAGDTATVTAAARAIPRVLPPAQARYDGRAFMFWGTLSDGSVARSRVRLGLFRPRVSVTSGMGGGTDTVPAIDVDRWPLALVRQVWHCKLPTAVMGGAGALLAPEDRHGRRDRLGAAGVAALLALAGCLAG